MSELLTIPLLQELFGETILESHAHRGDETVIIPPQSLEEVATRLQQDERLRFEFLMDLTAVDYLHLDRPKRFEVVYHFYSLTHNRRLRVKVRVDDGEPVPTLALLWKTADWFERETAEMYGIKFAGHPDPRPLLLYPEFKGYPLRKDYDQRASHPLVESRRKGESA
ncbi:MAG: NADH-quinone oxidoreductase subunit C [Candidatus Delongbacteria bacterium]|nr:NADH-quinone oxidoreductase subunit C [Candidatus Delongbacteria bacterium]